MSKGGSTTSSQTYTMDPQVAARYNEIYNRGVSAANSTANPYTAYTGELTAPFNGLESQAANLASTSANSASGLNTYGTIGNLQNANAGTVGGTDLSAYMNPYTNNVINSSLGVLNQQKQLALNQAGDRAQAAGAFGGDRQAVEDANIQTQYGLQGAQLAAGLNQSNFQNAQTMANQDIQNKIAQQGVNLQAANSGLLGQTTSLNNLYNIGAGQQNTQQAADTAKYNQYLSGQMFPQSQVSYLSSLLSAIPQQGTTTSTQPYYNNMGSTLGGLGMLAYALL